MPVFRPQTSLENRVVLITGASEGIGAACVRALRAEGVMLSLNARSPEKLARIASPNDLVTPADITAPDTPGLLIERTLRHFGKVDILINNAGAGIYWPVSSSPDGETRAMFDLNFFAPLALAKAAIPHMRQRGSGTIVNVASIAGHVALPWMPLYSAAKSALITLTESLRTELAPAGIHVLLVSPGYILTEFHAHSRGLPPPSQVVQSKRFAIGPERCAADIVSGLKRNARIVVTPRWGWFMIGMHRLAPRTVEARLIRMAHPGEAA